MKRAALHNLGCKVNAYETEAMAQLLSDGGYTIVDFDETADVYVINTCSVTNVADRKSRQMIRRARAKNPDAVVVAAGCYVQTKEQEALLEGTADILLGNNKKGELLKLLAGVQEKRGTKALSDVTDIGAECAFENLKSDKPAGHTRAFIKVQDGCNQFCSYCIIPYARGRIRSRSRADVKEEVRALAANGYREVVLTGIHLSSYGADCGEDLIGLIRSVHETEGIERIRLGSLEPKIVTPDFAAQLAGLDKICPHFHLSLQSGCDDTLARMNRKYTTAEYRKSVALLRAAFDHPAITTDVIVGFPGETEEEFAKTKAFLSSVRFYEMHIFRYSRRKGTRADAMEGQVSEKLKAARSGELLAMERRMSEEFRSYYRGVRKEALMEELQTVCGVPMYVGYTREYVRVAAPSEAPLLNRSVSGVVCDALEEGIYRLQLC